MGVGWWGQEGASAARVPREGVRQKTGVPLRPRLPLQTPPHAIYQYNNTIVNIFEQILELTL